MIHTPQSLVDTFGLWADAANVKRFWGIAKLGDGRLCLLLPSLAEDYRTVIVESGELTFIVSGPSTAGAHNEEAVIGKIGDPPGAVFTAAILWLLETAESMTGLDLPKTAQELAHTAQRVAFFVHDDLLELKARHLLLRLTQD